MAGANILLIETDSMDGRVMGCAGHPAMSNATPNIDRLSRQGVRFANAYCNNPICCPSRASMWSGQFTHHCEGWNNHKGLEPGTPTFQTRLEEAGYRTRILGKTDYLSGFHTVRARVTPWTRAALIRRPCYRMGPPRVLDDDTARVHTRDWEDVDGAVAWLREHGRDERPFMLYLGIRAPHPGFTTSRRYLELIDERTVQIPPKDERTHPAHEYHVLQKNWEHGLDERTVRLVRRIYFAMIAEVDSMVGEVVSALDQLGLGEHTHVIFTSDHGEMAMEHGTFYKMSAYEPSSRVPLVIRGPGVRSGAVVDELASLVDIYPTLMDIAEAPRPAGLDGHSLLPLAAGVAADRPDWVLCECHDSTCVTGVFMLRRGSWKFVAHPGCAPQLFDLAADPWEIHDLAASRPATVKEMDEFLRRVVDYESVDRKVKEYDRRSFLEWRDRERAAGTYAEKMARVYSGWDRLSDESVRPWTADDEARIEAWLAGTGGPPPPAPGTSADS